MSILRTFCHGRARTWVGGLLLVLATAGVGRVAEARTVEPQPGHASIGERLAQRLPRLHLLHMEMGDDISSRTWTNLIVSLDYERLYFLQSDIEAFRARATTLDDALKRGDISFAFDVFDTFKQRLSNRVDYIAQVLESGFDWTQDETYMWERKRAPWPVDAADWDDLWRRKIKNEYVRLLISREQADSSNVVALSTMDAGLNEAALIDGKITTLVSSEPTPSNPPALLSVPSDLVTMGPGSTLTGATAVVAMPTNGASLTEGDDPIVAAGPEEEISAAAATNAVPPEPIEVVLLKRYRQAQTIIEDSDADALLQRYLTAFTQAYDPHSTYLTPSALKDFEIEMKLSLFGIGALLSAEDGAAKIVRLIPGGPADRDTREKRLRPGDKIIGVGQDTAPSEDVLHWPLNKVVEKIRGDKGTRVVLTVIPATDASSTVTKIVDLVRDEVKLEDQAATGSVHNVIGSDGMPRTLGVVRLPAFYSSMDTRSPDDPGFRSAVYDVVRILTGMQKQGVSGVLFDLRGNGGGALVEAIDMTGLFIRQGPTVQVKERFLVRPLDDEDPRIYYNGPLVVLVNRLSASASEIVAGALQDYGRAIIVGDSKTHGKGTVQSVLDLGRDASMGALKVTTASYIRITGASTQLQGVQPDIVVPSPWDFMETGEEFLPNAIPWSMERAANFQRVADLGTIIPRLRELSEQRRRQSGAFQTYARLLARFSELNDTHELPLNLETRRQLAATERELNEMQERLAAEEERVPTADGGTNRVTDLVLTEGLSILADLVTVETVGPDALPPVEDNEGPARSVAEWKKENP